MNYIEELLARQGALLRAVSRTGSRRRAEESREGEKSPSPAAEVWELAEETAPFLAENDPISEKSVKKAAKTAGRSRRRRLSASGRSTKGLRRPSARRSGPGRAGV